MSRKQRSKPTSVSADDRALFREVLSGKTPIPDSDHQADWNSGKILPQSDVTDAPVLDRNPAKGILRQDGDLFYRAGVQKSTLKRLKRGHFKTNAEIDLHGCTGPEALRYLQTFLDQSHIERLDCVRIITGKGRSSPGHHSVVRETALNVLRNEPRVLAYSCAPPGDGGSGAFYVLLSS